jgi:hypothetical protein
MVMLRWREEKKKPKNQERQGGRKEGRDPSSHEWLHKLVEWPH